MLSNMFKTSINLDTILIPRHKQEQEFRKFLLHWKTLLQISILSTTQSDQPPSPHNQIQSPITLLFGNSGLGKSTLLKRYRAIAAEPDYHLAVPNTINWQFIDGADSTQFATSSAQLADPLAYFNMMHRKLAEALSKQPEDLKMQLNNFRDYKQAAAVVRKVRERVSHIVGSLHTDERYEPLIWLTGPGLQAGIVMLKLIQWCFEKPWFERDEEQVEKILARYIGKTTSIEKKHLSQLLETLQNNLQEQLDIYLHPEQLLAHALGHDLSTFAQNIPLLFVFDTYERIAGGDIWLRGIMHAAGKHVGWIIAGQGNIWSTREQEGNNFKAIYRYHDIVPADRLLSVDISTAGVFSAEDILDYFSQLGTQMPSLKQISQADAKRIFDSTQGIPLIISSVASSYLYEADLNNILESAERNMAQLYFLHAQDDEEERKKLYGLALLRRVNNPSVVTSVLNLNAQQSYTQILQQLHDRYHFVSIEQGQPLLHEKVRNILRRWLLSDARATQSFTVVAERVVEAQQSQLQKLELYYNHKSLQDFMEDDEWINTYQDFIEASFWFNPEIGTIHALTFILAATLYRVDIIHEIEQLCEFFIDVIPPLHRNLWLCLIQSLSAETQHATTFKFIDGLEELHQQLAHLTSLPHPSPSSENRMDYEKGLEHLKRYVSETDRYQEFLIYENRLRENLSNERLYGTNEQSRTGRAETIHQLNRLAHELTDGSFNDLCMIQGGFPDKYARELEGALWWLQGRIYRKYAKNAASATISLYQNAFKNLSTHSRLQEDFASTYWLIAAEHFKQQRYEQSIGYLDEALLIKNDYVHAYYSLGNTFYEMGRYQDAIVQYQYVLCLDKYYTPAFTNLGNAYSELKQFENAIEEYNISIALDKQNYLSYYNRGYTYGELKRYNEARNDFSQSIALNADFAHAYISRGNIHGILRNYARAQADYKQAAEVDPQDIHAAWMAMWASFGKTLRENEVQEQLEKLIPLAPQHYVACIGSAMSMALQRHKLNTIKPVLAQAFHQKPEQWDTYFWQGIILAYYRQTEEAKRSINQALDLDLPPVLLIPLYWLEHVVPRFFQAYARPLLNEYDL